MRSRALDAVPYFGIALVVMLYPFWVLGVPGDPNADTPFVRIWTAGFLALTLYVPAILILALAEWIARRVGWHAIERVGAAIRWAYFLAIVLSVGGVLAYVILD